MKPHLTTFFFVFFLSFGLLSFFNWFVDPLWLFKSGGYPGINLVKPEFKKHLRLIKAHHVKQIRPLAFALGTSATETMFDMSSPLWGVSADRRYNLGLAGSNMYEQLRYFEHAVNVQKPEVVILSLDFEAFRIRKEPKPDFDTSRLLQSDTDFRSQVYLMRDMANALLNFQFFKKSLTTLSSQGSKLNQYERSGQRNLDYHLSVYNRLGFEALATKSLTSIMSKRFEFEVNGCHRCTTIKYLRRILDISRQRGIDLKLIINPYHDWFLTALVHSDNWGYYERWLHAIVEEIERESAEANAQPFELVTFNPLTLTDGTRLSSGVVGKNGVPYFWDLVHASGEIGEPVLATLFDDQSYEVKKIRYLKLNYITITPHLKRLRGVAEQNLSEMTPSQVLLIKETKDKTIRAREINTTNSKQSLKLIRKKGQLVLSEGLYR